MGGFLGWAGMKIKPSKSPSWSVRKWVRNHHNRWTRDPVAVKTTLPQPGLILHSKARELCWVGSGLFENKEVGRESVRKQLAACVARIH